MNDLTTVRPRFRYSTALMLASVASCVVFVALAAATSWRWQRSPLETPAAWSAVSSMLFGAAGAIASIGGFSRSPARRVIIELSISLLMFLIAGALVFLSW